MVLALLVLVVAAGVSAMIWFPVLFSDGATTAASPSPSPSPSLATGIDPVAVDELEERLSSGDAGEVAAALALEVDQVPPELVSGLAASAVDIHHDEAERIAEDAWRIPATLEMDGVESNWNVFVIESDQGLVFLDSAPQDPEEAPQ